MEVRNVLLHIFMENISLSVALVKKNVKFAVASQKIDVHDYR